MSVNEVEIARKNMNQIIHLYEASSGLNENKNIVSITSLDSAVKERLEEYELFNKRHKQLSNLCCHFGAQVEGKNSNL